MEPLSISGVDPLVGTQAANALAADASARLAVEELAEDSPATPPATLRLGIATPAAALSAWASRFADAQTFAAAAAAALAPRQPENPLPWLQTVIVNGRSMEVSELPQLQATVFSIQGHAITLLELLVHFQKGLPGYRLASFNVETLSPQGIRVRLSLSGKNGESAARLNFTIRPNHAEPTMVRDLYSEIRVFDRRHGLGTILMTQWLLLLKRLGFERLEVTLGNMGVDHWPRRGFDFLGKGVRRAIIQDFTTYVTMVAFKEGRELTAQQRQRLANLKHAWELAEFTLEIGQKLIAVGRNYLLGSADAFDAKFELDDHYPGWRYLRRELEKIGQGHLLPNPLGRY